MLLLNGCTSCFSQCCARSGNPEVLRCRMASMLPCSCLAVGLFEWLHFRKRAHHASCQDEHGSGVCADTIGMRLVKVVEHGIWGVSEPMISTMCQLVAALFSFFFKLLFSSKLVQGCSGVYPSSVGSYCSLRWGLQPFMSLMGSCTCCWHSSHRAPFSMQWFGG